MFSLSDPNTHGSSKPRGVYVIIFIGVDQGYINVRHRIFGGLSSHLFKDMLGCEKKMRCEPCDPVGKMDDEMILFFFIHGGEYLREFLVN
jgi:hypothetical protein